MRRLMDSARDPSAAGRLATMVSFGAAAFVVGIVGFRTIAAPSFWTSLSAGRDILAGGIPRFDTWTFTTTGTAWIDVHWMHDLLAILLWKAGGAGLVILAKVAAIGTAIALAARMALRNAAPVATALAAILMLVAMAPHLDATPVVFALPFAAAMALRMSMRPSPKADYAILLPLQIAWFNMDPSGILGPLIATAGAVATWMEYRRGLLPDLSMAGLRARLAAPLVLAVACCISPYGPAHLQHVLTGGMSLLSATDSPLLASLARFHSAPPTRLLLTCILALCAMGLVIPRIALPAHAAAAGAVGACILFKAPGAMAMFAALSLPFLAFSIEHMAAGAARILRRSSRHRRTAPESVAGVAVLVAATWAAVVLPGHMRKAGSLSRPGIGTETGHLARGAADVLGRDGFPVRVFCLPGDGAYLRWTLPGRPVFMDLRTGLRDAGFDALVARFLAGDAATSSAIIDRWKIDAVVLNMLVPGAAHAVRRLVSDGGWALVFLDGVSAVLLPNTPVHARWIRDSGLQSSGLDELRREADAWCASTDAGRRPTPSPRLIGAGMAFSALGFAKASASAFDLALRGDPTLAPLYLHLGTVRLAGGDAQGAVEAFRRHTAADPNSAPGWTGLSEALKKTGRTNDAMAAAMRAGTAARPD